MFLTKLDLNLHSRKTANWLRNPYNVHIDLWKAFSDKATKGASQPFLYRFDLKDNFSNTPPRILVLSGEEPNWDEALVSNSILLGEPITKKLPSLDFIQKGALFRFSLVANPTQKIIDYRKLFQEELKGYPESYSRRLHKEYLEGKERLKQLVEEVRKTDPEKLEAFRMEKKPGKKNEYKQYKNMKKVGIYEESDQIEWLRNQGRVKKVDEPRGGYELIETKINNQEGNPASLFSAYSFDTESKYVEIMKKDKVTKEKLPPIKLHIVHFTGILRVTDAEAFKRAYAQGIGSGKAFGCGMLLLARV